jgi:hypothetical protein
MFEIQVYAIKWVITTRFRSKLVAQTKKNMLSSKMTKAEVQAEFQDGCRRHFVNSSERYKIGNYHPYSMKIGTQIQKSMLSSKFTIPEV